MNSAVLRNIETWINESSLKVVKNNTIRLYSHGYRNSIAMRVPVGVLYYDHIVYYFRDKARYLSEYCQRLVTVDSWRYINIIYVCMYVKRLVRKNYTVHEKQSHRIISIILFRSDEIL